MHEVAARLFPTSLEAEPAPPVALTSFDPDAEVKLVTAMLYPHTHLPERQIEDRVRAMTDTERVAVVDAYVGDRANRRHKPGRGLERLTYRFDILADYGAFRDLQRHRMLTVEWQTLSPRHGYTRPDVVDAAGFTAEFDGAMARSAELHDALFERFPAQAPYAVSLAYHVRFVHAAQRPRGDAPHRAAHHAPGPPRLPPRRPGDAPPHRRGGRPPGGGGAHAPRRPGHRAGARAAGGRAACRGPPPLALIVEDRKHLACQLFGPKQASELPRSDQL